MTNVKFPPFSSAEATILHRREDRGLSVSLHLSGTRKSIDLKRLNASHALLTLGLHGVPRMVDGGSPFRIFGDSSHSFFSLLFCHRLSDVYQYKETAHKRYADCANRRCTWYIPTCTSSFQRPVPVKAVKNEDTCSDWFTRASEFICTRQSLNRINEIKKEIPVANQRPVRDRCILACLAFP